VLVGPERYRVKVSGFGGVREWEVSEPSAVYAEGSRTADFPVGGEAVLEVAQVSSDAISGAWATLRVSIPAP
jgi:hypothetical protein